MPSPTRFLQSSSQLPAAPPPVPLPVDSDVVVILAALLCALICVVGLALVARCAWLRRFASNAAPPPPPPLPLPTKGLKKKALRSLPIISFDGSVAAAAGGGNLAECPICLAEFASGDEIRILPHCGHGFHVTCVDTWLGSHSSCPSCRQILVVPAPSRCRRCGATSVDTAAAETDAKAGEDGGFLP